MSNSSRYHNCFFSSNESVSSKFLSRRDQLPSYMVHSDAKQTWIRISIFPKSVPVDDSYVRKRMVATVRSTAMVAKVQIRPKFDITVGARNSTDTNVVTKYWHGSSSWTLLNRTRSNKWRISCPRLCVIAQRLWLNNNKRAFGWKEKYLPCIRNIIAHNIVPITAKTNRRMFRIHNNLLSDRNLTVSHKLMYE